MSKRKTLTKGQFKHYLDVAAQRRLLFKGSPDTSTYVKVFPWELLCGHTQNMHVRDVEEEPKLVCKTCGAPIRTSGWFRREEMDRTLYTSLGYVWHERAMERRETAPLPECYLPPWQRRSSP